MQKYDEKQRKRLDKGSVVMDPGAGDQMYLRCTLGVAAASVSSIIRLPE